jgi:hypothetical protein
MNRAAYRASIDEFLDSNVEAILGRLVEGYEFAVESNQRDAWLVEIDLLKAVLRDYRGRGAVYFEYSVPRLGKRVDVIVIVHGAIFVLEFKVGEHRFRSQAIDQTYDYALDLKNFHEASHDCTIAPVLIATEANHINPTVPTTPNHDRLLEPICCSSASLWWVMQAVLEIPNSAVVDFATWERGRYCPTPTIIEAATALYRGHSVDEISRSDSGATNLTRTSEAVSEIIAMSKAQSLKSICLVTGVPGAGKTLVGLDIATKHFDKHSDLYSVFLSGNGPLVAVLREALARDKVRREREQGRLIKKGAARSEVKAFIQNVHHFRDDCLVDFGRPPIEHVAIFDEAQRAWNLEQTSKFMRQRKGRGDFSVSEPEFLISCLDRHSDWAVIVCLVGGGQEINTGEAGIGEWIDSLTRSFGRWHLHISSRLNDSEYGVGRIVERARVLPNVSIRDELHLGVSMRSFRAENVSLFVKQLLDLDPDAASGTLTLLRGRYPIVLTRSLSKAKQWLRSLARGSERYGIVVSSQAQRLKPHAIDVKSPVDPVHWFLDSKEDIRSSYFLEDVATEFHVQGLELDYACVTWDADFRFAGSAWQHWSFVGDRWNRIRKVERQLYQKNAYRVLLTRARQGMVIVVPEGDAADQTRQNGFYDSTYGYLEGIGLDIL